MKIRKIRSQDRAELEALLTAQENFNPEEIQVALELVDIVLNHPGQEDYIIRVAAAPDGKVLGYVCYGKAPLTDAVYDLYWIVVHPSFWNRGVGSSLLRGAEADLKPRGARLLLVETSSKPSYGTPRAFYRKHGYIEQARVHDYYSPGDHKLILGKTLK
jgi:ribosomal protein S18 acetylase RimI-like enzyme